MGYYLDDVEHLGHFDGEANNSIQALRDPFLLEKDGVIHIFWSAKAVGEGDNVLSAIGHATISDLSHPENLEILPPIYLPDSILYTQVELPNIIIRDDGHIDWFVSTTNRTSEAQAESETQQSVRHYQSKNLESKLEIIGKSSVVIDAKDESVYGANYFRDYRKSEQASNQFRVFYVDGVDEKNRLSLPETYEIK